LNRLHRVSATLAFVMFAAFAAPAQTTASSSTEAVRYTITLTDPEHHRLRVQILIPPGAASHDLQLPVWNATYQVRDFAQYVNRVRATDAEGKPLPVKLADKSRWQVAGTANGAEIQYEIVAAEPGPYGAELTTQHAFLNLAEILMYPVDARSSPLRVRYSGVPEGWHAATALPGNLATGFTADNYDRLVDSPIELGAFREAAFDEGGSHYRIVVDADPAIYNLDKLTAMVRRIVTTETAWMNDRPFDTYVFLYHFPPSGGGGGMEHAYSTAITLNSEYMAANPDVLTDVTAHEFFHLWNVKRIRPQSLEPVDYTRENYTRALWFCEGVTSTVENYTLLQASLLDESSFLARLSWTISDLERTPANLTQSAEESSLDAWLEKYSYYRMPERSISYYNKGELLGTILDLQLREATHGTKSLRDLFQWMNQNYAKQGRFFPDSDGVRLAAESLSGTDFKPFFEKYVAGTVKIPWDEFFESVGLHLVRATRQVAELSFSATRNFNEAPAVSEVEPNGDAQHAGLMEGDAIIEINGQTPGSDFEKQLTQMIPGTILHLKVRGRDGERKLQWKLTGVERVHYQLRDVDNPSTQQKARRAAWLNGESESSGASHP